MALDLSKSVFFISETKPELLPQSISEVAFVGRSNVGKSSVINAVCKTKNLARTSKTPGRTRAINIFTSAKGRWIVDLPGYGFARVTEEEKKVWQKMIETYITSRKTLKMIYILIDSFVGPTELDFVMMDWVRKLNIPFKIVSNKTDKVSNLNLEKLKDTICEICEVEKEDIYCVSAKKQTGFGKLINDIGNLLLK
ncbi:ribosome biogenesis GTP-binding protein YihA/YsxC [Candidatus Ruminimicrobiellum ovillum]|uniref:ribosome biogenesis GTP-binding protein YihA/YsxC n=1 Tax=Candidatus Ruminimicrobiellum ovillum TaxID=1947927 RepID=UPI003559C887